MAHEGTHLEDLLSAVTDALLREGAAAKDPLDAIARRYDVPRGEVEGFAAMIRRVHVALAGVQPSPRFVNRLRHDLIGQPPRGVLARVRFLPPRVQIAAGVVAVMGFMLITRRRLIGDAADIAGALTAAAGGDNSEVAAQ
jgi:hypothetical protein